MSRGRLAAIRRAHVVGGLLVRTAAGRPGADDASTHPHALADHVTGLGDSRGLSVDETGDILQRYKGEAAGGVKESAGESAQLQAG